MRKRTMYNLRRWVFMEWFSFKQISPINEIIIILEVQTGNQHSWIERAVWSTQFYQILGSVSETLNFKGR